MDYSLLMGLALQGIEFVLNQIHNNKTADMTSEQLADADAALVTLKKFHGLPVTKAQMESLRG